MPTHGATGRPIGSFARTMRLRRLYHHGDRLFIVPLDHSITDGPLVRGGHLDDLVRAVADHGADAVVLHKGCLRRLHPDRFSRMSLVLQLSASTSRAPDPDAKYLVASVEEAIRLGADAVSVHVNLGSRHEARQIFDLGAVGRACDRWDLPLIAMMYPRGPGIRDPRDTDLLAHAVEVAASLGADVVKTVYPGSPAAMATVTMNATVPVVVAGGPPSATANMIALVRGALDGGAEGMAIGRNIIQAEDPAAMTRLLADEIHGPRIEDPNDEVTARGTGSTREAVAA